MDVIDLRQLENSPLKVEYIDNDKSANVDCIKSIPCLSKTRSKLIIFSAPQQISNFFSNSSHARLFTFAGQAKKNGHRKKYLVHLKAKAAVKIIRRLYDCTRTWVKASLRTWHATWPQAGFVYVHQYQTAAPQRNMKFEGGLKVERA